MHMIKTLLYLALFLAATPSFAQKEEVRKEHFNLKKGLAIQGYDPVSYFNGKPQKGDPDLFYRHNGTLYHFISTENLEAFKKDPTHYEPQYGGWCAYAMGKTGEKVKIDPETFKVVDNRLYLFYNFWGNNTLNGWNDNEKSLKNDGDKNWDQLIH